MFRGNILGTKNLEELFFRVESEMRAFDLMQLKK
jgi:hypothetical protein